MRSIKFKPLRKNIKVLTQTHPPQKLRNFCLTPQKKHKDQRMPMHTTPPKQLFQTPSEILVHRGQHGNATRTPIRDETSETDHTQKRRFLHSAIYQTIQALVILRCLYGSEMVLLGVVIGKCEMPSSDISQENDHAILILKRQFVAYNFY
jgi:hypothetical protein